MYTCVHVYMRICVYVYVYMCTCVHVYICAYVYMCICVYVYMCICVYVYVYVHMCICVYVYMCICTYVYIWCISETCNLEQNHKSPRGRSSDSTRKTPWYEEKNPIFFLKHELPVNLSLILRLVVIAMNMYTRSKFGGTSFFEFLICSVP